MLQIKYAASNITTIDQTVDNYVSWNSLYPASKLGHLHPRDNFSWVPIYLLGLLEWETKLFYKIFGMG